MNQIVINDYSTSVYKIVQALLPKTAVKSAISELIHEWGIEYVTGNGVIIPPLGFMSLLSITYPEDIKRNLIRQALALKGSLSYRLLDQPDPSKLKPDGFREIVFVNDVTKAKEALEGIQEGKGIVIGSFQKEKRIYFNHFDKAIKKSLSVAKLMENVLPFMKDSKMAAITIFMLNDVGLYESEGEKLLKIFKDRGFEIIDNKKLQ